MNPDDEKQMGQQATEHYLAEVRLLKDLLRRLNAHARQLDEDLETASREIKTLRQRIRSRDAEINNLYASRSWKITMPIRAVSTIARSAAGKIARLARGAPANMAGPPAETPSNRPEPGTQKKNRKPDLPLTPREKEILDALGRLMDEDRYGR